MRVSTLLQEVFVGLLDKKENKISVSPVNAKILYLNGKWSPEYRVH